LGSSGAVTDRVRDWVALVESAYPPSDAEEWDAPGLHVGDPDAPVERVLVTLDVTSAVVAEAATSPGTLVVAHHPLLLRPLARLTPSTAPGRVALAAARAGVAVMAAHTNLDVADDGTGTSDPLVALLGLTDVRPLTMPVRAAGSTLVTFIPVDAVDRALDAMVAAGAGRIGAYERCAFTVAGTGRFRPGVGAEPHVGAVGQDVMVEEVRLEVRVPRGAVGAVVSALRAAHPYEEVAIDLHDRREVNGRGIGRVGRLPTALTLGAVAECIAAGLPAAHLRRAGAIDRVVERVAVVGGGGRSLVPAALAAGADLLVTGDLDHHTALDASELGLALIDAGHHATEVAAMPAVVARLHDLGRQRCLRAPVLGSSVSTAPWGGP
jgi:dinuclear metal center YbgI/SA1388 family protein